MPIILVVMNMKATVKLYNTVIFETLAKILNENPCLIDEEMMGELACFPKEEAYRILLAGSMGIYENKDMMEMYMRHMVHYLNYEEYATNPYLKEIPLGNIAGEHWHVENLHYEPYELFVCNDIELMEDERMIPQLGFFDQTYTYPCIFEGDHEWMMITPNEINTMKEPISKAFGRVVTYGLGLGYFAFMVSNKEEVESVCIVESNHEVIELFKTYILPYFKHKEKIEIIEEDAFRYAKEHNDMDYVFVDIYHDPSDGVEIYEAFKKLEKDGIHYEYWIEKTLRCYMDD